MCYYKPYSVDAINWKRALMFGQLVIWDGMKFQKATRLDFIKSKMPPIASVIQQMGFDPYELKNEESWRRILTLAHEISTVSYLRYTKDLLKRLGTKFYFVCNSHLELDFLLGVFRGEKDVYKKLR